MVLSSNPVTGSGARSYNFWAKPDTVSAYQYFLFFGAKVADQAVGIQVTNAGILRLAQWGSNDWTTTLSISASVYSMINADLRKGMPESAIKKDIVKKGYPEKDAEKLLKETEISRITEVIKDHLHKGFVIDEIKKELISKGWNREMVIKAIEKVRKK